MILFLYIAVSACFGITACVLTLVCWSRRRDTFAKPGRATPLCFLAQSVVVGAIVGAFWWLAPFAIVAVYAWRRRRRDEPPPRPLQWNERIVIRSLPAHPPPPPPKIYTINAHGKKLE